MKNEIYEKAEAIAKGAQQQIQEYLNKNFKGAGIRAFCDIQIHDIPESEMPKDSEENIIKDRKYLSYSPLTGPVSMYSKSKHGRLVFDENPTTGNVKHETSKS